MLWVVPSGREVLFGLRHCSLYWYGRSLSHSLTWERTAVVWPRPQRETPRPERRVAGWKAVLLQQTWNKQTLKLRRAVVGPGQNW